MFPIYHEFKNVDPRLIIVIGILCFFAWMVVIKKWLVSRNLNKAFKKSGEKEDEQRLEMIKELNSKLAQNGINKKKEELSILFMSLLKIEKDKISEIIDEINYQIFNLNSREYYLPMEVINEDDIWDFFIEEKLINKGYLRSVNYYSTKINNTDIVDHLIATYGYIDVHLSNNLAIRLEKSKNIESVIFRSNKELIPQGYCLLLMKKEYSKITTLVPLNNLKSIAKVLPRLGLEVLTPKSLC